MTALDAHLHTQLLGRLQAARLAPDVTAEVQRALGDGPPPPAAAEGDNAHGTSRDVYLKSVTVEGFRGIGPAATLTVKPQPGLTVVVGRNGSGKSSFAEGLELLATGATKRWEGRTQGWSETWQCLHHEGPTRIAAEFVCAGQGTPVVLEQTWLRGVPYTDAAGRATVQVTLREHGWDAALCSFRPFLAYAELASIFDKLSSLPTALSPILGLEALDHVCGELAQERLAIERDGKAVKAERERLLASLDGEDPRQAELADLLAARKPALDAIRTHVLAHPPGADAPGTADGTLRRLAQASLPDDEALTAAAARRADAAAALAAVATTDAARALATADLLGRALQLQDRTRLTDDCPVCRTAGVLDATWAADAQAQISELRTRATAMVTAERARDAADTAWVAHARAVRTVDDDATVDPSLRQLIERAAAARGVVAEARAALAQEDATWRARIEDVAAWIGKAETAATLKPRVTALKAAEDWVKAQADVLRNERFAPIAEQAVANWELLRHESNVELRDITLKSVGRRKEATFDVRADGEHANAMGVMSQGELLALSVSVFLPRAALDESPFRFAVIDDPVQSMDPAKVDGLARILQQAAATRQVIVFTHDDRLPEAIRRLKLAATVLQVNRQSRSQVSVSISRTPMSRHLADAKHMALSHRVPEEVRRRVVPTLCRGAVEAACAELVRSRVVRDGLDPQVADEHLEHARTLRELLTLALLGPGAEQTELAEALRRAAGPDAHNVVAALNAGAHADYRDDLEQLQSRTSGLITALMQTA